VDRTTLGRNIRPLERDGLIAIESDPSDRRSKILRLTKAGEARFRTAVGRPRGYERACAPSSQATSARSTPW
jgi:DNA-binding MarR family transcriptional regulator